MAESDSEEFFPEDLPKFLESVLDNVESTVKEQLNMRTCSCVFLRLIKQ